MLICRAWITRKGKRIYAHQCGLKAFCFEVDENQQKKESVVDKTTDPNS